MTGSSLRIGKVPMTSNLQATGSSVFNVFDSFPQPGNSVRMAAAVEPDWNHRLAKCQHVADGECCDDSPRRQKQALSFFCYLQPAA